PATRNPQPATRNQKPQTEQSQTTTLSEIIYIEYTFKVAPIQPASDILIAQLGEVGFESFVETDEGVLAYINKKDWKPDILHEIQILKNPNFQFDYTYTEIEQENWNSIWES